VWQNLLEPFTFQVGVRFGTFASAWPSLIFTFKKISLTGSTWPVLSWKHVVRTRPVGRPQSWFNFMNFVVLVLRQAFHTLSIHSPSCVLHAASETDLARVYLRGSWSSEAATRMRWQLPHHGVHLPNGRSKHAPLIPDTYKPYSFSCILVSPLLSSYIALCTATTTLFSFHPPLQPSCRHPMTSMKSACQLHKEDHKVGQEALLSFVPSCQGPSQTAMLKRPSLPSRHTSSWRVQPRFYFQPEPDRYPGLGFAFQTSNSTESIRGRAVTVKGWLFAAGGLSEQRKNAFRGLKAGGESIIIFYCCDLLTHCTTGIDIQMLSLCPIWPAGVCCDFMNLLFHLDDLSDAKDKKGTWAQLTKCNPLYHPDFHKPKNSCRKIDQRVRYCPFTDTLFVADSSVLGSWKSYWKRFYPYRLLQKHSSAFISYIGFISPSGNHSAYRQKGRNIPDLESTSLSPCPVDANRAGALIEYAKQPKIPDEIYGTPDYSNLDELLTTSVTFFLMWVPFAHSFILVRKLRVC